MIPVPHGNERELVDLANTLVDQCRVSVGTRGAYYRILNAICETGRVSGTKSLINMMYPHLARTAAHLFSPIQLKFAIDYERPQNKTNISRGQETAKVVTRKWERDGTDQRFHRGVFESLKYGAAIHKQWVWMEGVEQNIPQFYDKIVMPWQFGVYREDENSLDRQEALCETILLTMPEVWQRIWHLPDAKKLFAKIKANAAGGTSSADPQSFFHQILSTNTLDASASLASRPGGIMQLNSDPSYQIMAPTVAPETVQMHELWVKDEDDYTTIQLIEPDIIVAPRHKKANLLVAGSRLHPYRLIQPNEVTNWFWGRSELTDIVEPQKMLSVWADDVLRLWGLQVDKLLGFVGETGVTDEIFGQFRQSGWMNLPQGAKIEDITPKFPPEALPMLKFLMEVINIIGGFPEIMQGKGESGVRASVHAETLLKTAAPTLRDRSLLVERQCAGAAQLTLELMQAKDESKYWLKADTPTDVEETQFLLSELPDDARIIVDSHSSSPIFSDENTQLIFAGAKMGYIFGDYVLDNMPFPNKELAKTQLKEKEKAQADYMNNIMQTRPDLAEEVLKLQAKGGKR